MKICPKCGHENDDTVFSCQECGAALSTLKLKGVDDEPKSEKANPVGNEADKFAYGSKKNEFEDLEDKPFVVDSTPKKKEGELYSAMFSRTNRKELPLQLLIGVGIIVIAVIMVFIYYAKRKVGGGYQSPDSAINAYVESINEYDAEKYFRLFPSVTRDTALNQFSSVEKGIKEYKAMEYKFTDYRITDKKELDESQRQHIADEIKQFTKKSVKIQEAYMVSWESTCNFNILGLTKTGVKEDHVFTVVKIKDEYYIYGLKNYEW